MVLLSEFLVSGSALVFLNIYFAQIFTDASRNDQRGRNHAALYAGGMLSLYSATRLLLETESPQSVIPGFILVVVIIAEILKRGTYNPAEILVRICTVIIVSLSLLVFSYFKGLVFLSERAQENVLDRELVWYHTLAIFLASYRWIVIFILISFPVMKPKWGWILMLVRIAAIWAVWLATGRSVTTSPWGALDEILLERNSLLYLIMSLITFSMVTDQIAATVVAAAERKVEATGSKPVEISWDEIKNMLFTSQDSSSEEPDNADSNVGSACRTSDEESDRHTNNSQV